MVFTMTALGCPEKIGFKFCYGQNNDDFEIGQGTQAFQGNRMMAYTGLLTNLIILSSTAENIFKETLKSTREISIRIHSLRQRVGTVTKVAVEKRDQLLNNTSMLYEPKTTAVPPMPIVEDQNLFCRATAPRILMVQYENSAAPPALGRLEKYAEPGKPPMKGYSDPEFFFHSWKESYEKKQAERKALMAEKRAQRKLLNKRASQAGTAETTAETKKKVPSVLLHRRALNPLGSDFDSPTNKAAPKPFNPLAPIVQAPEQTVVEVDSIDLHEKTIVQPPPPKQQPLPSPTCSDRNEQEPVHMQSTIPPPPPLPQHQQQQQQEQQEHITPVQLQEQVPPEATKQLETPHTPAITEQFHEDTKPAVRSFVSAPPLPPPRTVPVTPPPVQTIVQATIPPPPSGGIAPPIPPPFPPAGFVPPPPPMPSPGFLPPTSGATSRPAPAVPSSPASASRPSPSSSGGMNALLEAIRNKDVVLKKVDASNDTRPPPKYEKTSRGLLLESIQQGVTLRSAAERKLPAKVVSPPQASSSTGGGFDVASILKDKFKTLQEADTDTEDDDEDDDDEWD